MTSEEFGSITIESFVSILIRRLDVNDEIKTAALESWHDVIMPEIHRQGHNQEDVAEVSRHLAHLLGTLFNPPPIAGNSTNSTPSPTPHR